MVKWYYGTEAAYNAAKSTFATGIYICTDNGKLYVHGTEVKDAYAIDVDHVDASGKSDAATISYTTGPGNSVIGATLNVKLRESGKTLSVKLPDAGNDGYGCVSYETLMAMAITGLTVDNAGEIQIKVGPDGNQMVAAKATIPTVTTASGANKGIVSGSTLKAIDDKAGNAKSTLDGFNASVKTALTKAPNAAGGVVVIDSDTKIPASVLPSYVDDVVNFDGTVTGITATAGPIVVSGVTKFYYDTTGKRFVATNDGGKTYVTSWTGGNLQNVPATSAPEAGKIYVDTTKNTTYRWGGTDLVQIKGDLTIGTTAGTAYDGADGAQLRTDVDQLRTDLNTQADGIPSQIDVEQGGGKLTVQLKAATLLGTATELPAATTTNNGVMSAADKKELAQLRTDLGQKTDAASATGSAFARIAQNKADAADATQKANSAIKTIANGVGGYGGAGMTIQTTTVGGTSASVTLPAAKGATDAQPSGQSGVMSGADKVLLDSVAAVVASTAYWYQATVQ